MKTGIELIAEERQRQIEDKGWTAEHDDTHNNEEMARAASIYAMPERNRAYNGALPYGWPWGGKWYKPEPYNRIRELKKAGALIAAEIDRLNRIEHKPIVNEVAVYIEYIVNYRLLRLEKMGMNMFVYRNIAVQVDGERLPDHRITEFMVKHNIEYDKVIGLLINGGWLGTLKELKLKTCIDE